MEERRQDDFWHELSGELKDVWQSIRNGWQQGQVSLHNAMVDMRHQEAPYVMIPLEGPYIERDDPPRSFIERQLPLPLPNPSLQYLKEQLKRIAAADNVRGVVFVNRGFSGGPAMVQSVRQQIDLLRQAGKKVAMFVQYLDTGSYYLAAASDLVIMPPGSQFTMLGLYSEITFLKNALSQLGIHIDLVQISPYKSGGDNLAKAEISPEYQEQLNWLYDDLFDILTADIAAGRGMSQLEFQELLDEAPFTTESARDKGLIDYLGYEDDIAAILAEWEQVTAEAPDEVAEGAAPVEPAAEQPPEENGTAAAEDDAEQSTPKPVKIFSYEKAYPLLKRIYYRQPRKFVGVISVEGPIIPGPSQPPLPRATSAWCTW